MGIGGDAILHDGLSDLGDCRHSNLLKGNGYGKSGDDDLQLLEFEILDSEDELEDDDPFKNVKIKRAATSIPVEVSRRVVKRSRTDPAELKKNKNKKQKDLLTVLLPDNVDSSVISNDLSILQESTQLTTIVSHHDTEPNRLTSEDLKTVLEEPEAATVKSSEGSQDYVLEKIEHYNATSKEWKERSEAEEVLSSQEAGQVEENADDNTKAEVTNDNVSKKEEAEIGLEDQHQEQKELNASTQNIADVDEPEPLRSTSQEPNKDQTTKSKEVTIGARPTKRKSTLAELCARKNTVPHRVGLSKRANINHLHSYLSKK